MNTPKNHYFSTKEPEKSKIKSFQYIFNEIEYSFDTDIGVFSVGKIDYATETLLKKIPPLQGSLLDMGCGFGCIGIILAKQYNLDLVQADINPRAVRLTAENAKKNGVISQVIQSDKFGNISQLFNTIVINPPIHAGKKIIFEMYHSAVRFLLPKGELYVVIQKKHGANSSIQELHKVFGNMTVMSKKNGIYVICVQKKP
ncbi:MAG: methyltransferase [Firmicutes bacterium]|nr:methyltransferase [Bacillota bacterium]